MLGRHSLSSSPCESRSCPGINARRPDLLTYSGRNLSARLSSAISGPGPGSRPASCTDVRRSTYKKWFHVGWKSIYLNAWKSLAWCFPIIQEHRFSKDLKACHSSIASCCQVSSLMIQPRPCCYCSTLHASGFRHLIDTCLRNIYSKIYYLVHIHVFRILLFME